jgi:hypothetical protein
MKYEARPCGQFRALFSVCIHHPCGSYGAYRVLSQLSTPPPLTLITGPPNGFLSPQQSTAQSGILGRMSRKPIVKGGEIGAGPQLQQASLLHPRAIEAAWKIGWVGIAEVEQICDHAVGSQAGPTCQVGRGLDYQGLPRDAGQVESEPSLLKPR